MPNRSGRQDKNEGAMDKAKGRGILTLSLCVGAPALLRARNLQDALYPSGHPCRFESSATRIHSRVDAKLPELRFRAQLNEGEPESELALG